MKVSVSIPDDDLEFIDAYAKAHNLTTRSGVIQRALDVLRASELGDDYAAAWAEWEDVEADVWEPSASDGIS